MAVLQGYFWRFFAGNNAELKCKERNSAKMGKKRDMALNRVS